MSSSSNSGDSSNAPSPAAETPVYSSSPSSATTGAEYSNTPSPTAVAAATTATPAAEYSNTPSPADEATPTAEGNSNAPSPADVVAAATDYNSTPSPAAATAAKGSAVENVQKSSGGGSLATPCDNSSKVVIKSIVGRDGFHRMNFLLQVRSNVLT